MDYVQHKREINNIQHTQDVLQFNACIVRPTNVFIAPSTQSQ